MEDCRCSSEGAENLNGNTCAASAAELELKCLRELQAQLLDTQLRLQNRWVAPEKLHIVDNFSSISTAGTEAGEVSPIPSISDKHEQLQFLPVWGAPVPEHCRAANLTAEPCHAVSGIDHVSAPTIREIWKDLVDGQICVHWPVDAKKLRCKDRQIISPSFEIFPGEFFKLMIMPKATGEKKGQASFQKARGCGYVVLKQVVSVEDATLPSNFLFRIAVGSGELRQTSRGPVAYDFGSSVCGLAKRDELWDFLSAVNADSSVLTVSLEVLLDLAGAMTSKQL